VTCSPVDQASRCAIGDWAPRCHQLLGAAGTKAAVGPRSHTTYIKNGTLASEGDAMAWRQGPASSELHRTPWEAGDLGTMPPAPSCCDGDLGTEGSEGPILTRVQGGR
jgi:hypothetical protein